MIPKTIRILETRPVNPTPSRAAHHEATKQQKRLEGQEDRSPACPAQTRVPGNPLSERRPAYRSQRPDPHVTEEALVSTVLLNNPILDNIKDLGYPIFHMGTESSNLPDLPWFPRPDAPFLPQLVSFNENRQPID